MSVAVLEREATMTLVESPSRVTGEPTRRKFTREEYMWLGEKEFFGNERVERIEGDIVVMSPVGTKHAVCVTLVQDVLGELFRKGFVVRIQQPISPDDDNDPQPDAAVIQGAARDHLAAHPPTACLIVEVSESSLAYDRGFKASLYSRSGVPDYWILDVVHNRLEIRRNPEEMPDAPLGWAYANLEILGPDDDIAPLEKPDARIKVADLLP